MSFPEELSREISCGESLSRQNLSAMILIMRKKVPMWGYRWDLQSNTSHDPHVTPWEPGTYKPRASNIYNWAGIPAEHGGCSQALDAVTYQASSPG
jgi:hypothetical protein